MFNLPKVNKHCLFDKFHIYIFFLYIHFELIILFFLQYFALDVHVSLILGDLLLILQIICS